MFVRRLLVSAVLACLSACAAVPTPMSTNSASLPQSSKNEATRIGNVNAMNHQTMPRRTDHPHSSTQSNHSVANTSSCLRQKLASEFKLPAEFINHKVYTDNNHSVGLINPFTQTEGITMDVIGKGASSEIKLYGNGNLLSRAWQQLPSKCGQGKTTTVAQIVPPSQTASTQMAAAARPANNSVNFVARTQEGTNNAWIDTRNNPNANVQTTTVTTPRVVNTPHIAAITTPAYVPTNPTIAAAQNSSATPSNWSINTELTQDDMNIVAPLTAAMIAAPLAAKALSHSNSPIQQLTNNTANNRAAVPNIPARAATTSNNRAAIASNAAAPTRTAANTSATRTSSSPTASTVKRTTATTVKKTTTPTTVSAAKKSSTKSNSSKAIVDNKKSTRSQQAAQKATANSKNTSKTVTGKKTSKTVATKNTANKTTNKATTNKKISNKTTSSKAKNNKVTGNKKTTTNKANASKATKKPAVNKKVTNQKNNRTNAATRNNAKNVKENNKKTNTNKKTTKTNNAKAQAKNTNKTTSKSNTNKKTN